MKMGPSCLPVGSSQREKGRQGASSLAFPGQGGSKPLCPRAVKGHCLHCTEKKGRLKASNVPGEVRVAPLLDYSLLPWKPSLLRSLCVHMRHWQVWRDGRDWSPRC
jgi:hypothetical protein